MTNDLTVIEENLMQIAPELQQAIPPSVQSVLPAERIIRTLCISVERNKGLLQCTLPSLVNAAWSAACLGLEVDGVTGQAFLIPYKIGGVPTAQLQIGYKGFNTLFARSGYTCNSGIVHEGDEIEYQLGSEPFIRHVPKMQGRENRQMLFAWASATSKDRPPVVEVMGMDEIMAIKGRSRGARKKDSPWNDAKVGFPAMAQKTVKRRLARQMPLNIVQLASALDSYGEAGKHVYLDPESKTLAGPGATERGDPDAEADDSDDADVQEGEFTEPGREPPESYDVILNANGKSHSFSDFTEYFRRVDARLDEYGHKDLKRFAALNRPNIEKYQWFHSAECQRLLDKMDHNLGEFDA